jgi:hypothetical protein
MKKWDLTTGSATLERIMQNLRLVNLEVERLWRDQANSKFQENYIKPLEPKVRNLIDSVRRLSEALDNAERQCGPHL